MKGGLLVGALVLLLASPASAASSLEFRYWGLGLYNGSVTTPRHVVELRHEPSRWGLRLWGAVGQGDDYCASDGMCFDHAFMAADVTYRLTPWLRAFAGGYHLFRDRTETYACAQTFSCESVYQSQRHQGWRVGLMVTKIVAPRLILTGEAAYLWDHSRGQIGEWVTSGAGSGISWQAAAQYVLSPTTYATVGYESWGFHLPGGPYGPWGYHEDHVWRGWFVGVGVRR